MHWEFIHHLGQIYDLLDDLEVQKMERDYPILWERIHATSCAQIGRLLAEKRGVDKEMAALACALHDMGRWISGRQADHAPKGENLAREFLHRADISEAQRELIVQAIIHHSEKEKTGTALQEIVKDADILDCYWHGDIITKPYHVARLQQGLRDLGISTMKEER